MKRTLTFTAAATATLALTAAAFAHPDRHDADHDDGLHAINVTSDQPFVEIEIRDGYRYIRSNGLPNHEPGRFPNRGNPNTITPQQYHLRVPVEPTLADGGDGIFPPRGPRVLFGVALNGVVWDPGTGEIWRDGQHVRGGGQRPGDWNYEGITPQGKTLGLDQHNAHVQNTGTYHYHGVPHGLIEQLGGSKDQMLLIGWAADGFPIYAPWGHEDANDAESPIVDLTPSYRIKAGERPANSPGGSHDGTFTQDYEYVEGSGTLDQFNGRTGVTPEFPEGTYYYVITEGFPFAARTHRGEPDESFTLRHRLRNGAEEGRGLRDGRGGPGGPGGREGDREGRGPRERGGPGDVNPRGPRGPDGPRGGPRGGPSARDRDGPPPPPNGRPGRPE